MDIVTKILPTRFFVSNQLNLCKFSPLKCPKEKNCDSGFSDSGNPISGNLVSENSISGNNVSENCVSGNCQMDQVLP